MPSVEELVVLPIKVVTFHSVGVAGTLFTLDALVIAPPEIVTPPTCPLDRVTPPIVLGTAPPVTVR